MPTHSGRTLAARYRLQRIASQGPATTVWRAVDDALARPVAVKVLDDPDALTVRSAEGEASAAAFIAAAVNAGGLSHPRITSVYDAAIEDGTPYVVSAWVDGVALAELLRDGPLSPARATTIVVQATEAVAYAHSRGIAHGDLHAGNVLLASDGAVRVTDFCLAAVTSPVDGTGRDPMRADTRALAALLYTCLTGRAVDGSARGLPAAPERAGRLASPRQVRAGVPRVLDAVVMRALGRPGQPGPAITSAKDLLAALAPLPGEGVEPPAERFPARVGVPPRPLFRVGVPLAVVAGIGVAAWLAGLALGRVPGGTSRFAALGTPSPSAGATATALKPVSVRDFDPPPGDGRELPATVRLAYDGDQSTAWETGTYRNNPAFGNLKPGVGLLIDLGRTVTVTKVGLLFADPGVSVELRSSAAAAPTLAGYQLVAAARDTKESVELRPAGAPAARYWLIWITRLPDIGNGRYRAGVAEFAVFG